jgi:hypothetical protein
MEAAVTRPWRSFFASYRRYTMNLRNTLLVSTALVVAGTAASYWYLNTTDTWLDEKPKGADVKKFKVGFLPVT